MNQEIAPVVLVIIIVNVLMSMKGFNDIHFFEKYKFNIGSIKSGEKIRAISSGFLHADFSHLIFNMLTLYFFADNVLYILGLVGFLVVYFASLLIGSMYSFFINRNNNNYSAIGASGAVMGILYAAILLNPDLTLAFILLPIPIPGYIFAIGYLLYSVYGMKSRLGNIGHSAHIGGAIGGYITTILLFPEVLKYNGLLVGILAIPIILLIVFSKKFEA